MKKVLIVGYGSIGKRHANAFSDLRAEVALVSRQTIEGTKVFVTIAEALSQFQPEVVVVANNTALHEKSLRELNDLKFKGIVMVEKPLGHQSFEFQHDFSTLVVSYNLRMSPILEMLKQELAGKKIISANVYCGQYLPTWRPGRDYRDVYSAKKDQGGGVLRDLSHELDYSGWILGQMKMVVALGGHFSSLEIETDDVFTLLGSSDQCASINISINYLDRVVKRFILIHTDNETYYADMIAGKLFKNTDILLENIKAVDTYTEQARRILNGQLDSFCQFDEGVFTLKLIEAAEESYAQKRFVVI